jgi:hypothetical protein
VLRLAQVADIPARQRVRRSLRENRLTSGVITDAEVRAAIETTGRGWVIDTAAKSWRSRSAMPPTATSGRCSSIRRTSAAAMAGGFTTRWSLGCGRRACASCG